MRSARIALCALVACADVKADAGADAVFQVRAAQFRRGAMPADESGPAVLTATIPEHALAGRAEYGGGGELDRTATGVAVALSGDTGYWTLPAQIPSSGAPLAPTFAFAFGLAATLAPGERSIVV